MGKNKVFYLLVPLLAWVLAQGSKHIFRLLGRNRRVFTQNPRSALLVSGGMPSAHAATIVALTTIIGLKDGFDTVQFALSAWLAMLILYDAVMVRFSSGQQGDTLNNLLKEQKSRLPQLRVAHGHTPVEVLVGACLGAVVSLVVFFATK